jgi:rsbT co-antagonist protein RsbR
VVRKHEEEILTHWLQEQLQADTLRGDLIKESELRVESQQFLALFKNALQEGGTDINQPQWLPVKEFLSEMSRSRAVKGFTPSATATFVMSLKQPLLSRLLRHCGNNVEEFEKEAWSCNVVVDRLALYTVEVYSKGREEVIGRQQQEMLELSTPVVRLFEGVLALPLIGTLDSARTQVVMESLLTRIVETGASIAIIDITGVPMVDTLVAQHLLKTVAAARLMGADCIISGIRPQIAQTIVHLGVNLDEVTTKATMADAFMVALQRLGLGLRRAKSGGAANQEQ